MKGGDLGAAVDAFLKAAIMQAAMVGEIDWITKGRRIDRVAHRRFAEKDLALGMQNANGAAPADVDRTVEVTQLLQPQSHDDGALETAIRALEPPPEGDQHCTSPRPAPEWLVRNEPGLSMIYGFVKQSSGHIKIYSEVGQGTTVKLYLPRSAAIVESVEPAAVIESKPPCGEAILVVEDDLMVREFVVRQLERLGYLTIAAGNGTEALAVIDRGEPIHLMLTDVMMPGGMTGKQLALEAERRRPGLKVLYMSGYTENAILHHGRLDPDVALLSKPFRAADLERVVRETIAGDAP